MLGIWGIRVGMRGIGVRMRRMWEMGWGCGELGWGSGEQGGGAGNLGGNGESKGENAGNRVGMRGIELKQKKQSKIYKIQFYFFTEIEKKNEIRIAIKR